MESIPPELFLEGYPPGIRRAAERLRAVVRLVSPELAHVHLGFEYGVWMADPDNLLHGAHLKLRKVRFVTYEPGDPIPESALIDYTRDAARLATMSREERLAR